MSYKSQMDVDCLQHKGGDSTLLADAVWCHPEFASKVLNLIDEGCEDGLYKRRPRVDAIKCTEWPALITKFVFLLENTRSVPGQQQVSVRYGVRPSQISSASITRIYCIGFQREVP